MSISAGTTIAVVLAGLVGALGGAAVPRLVARIPEPDPAVDDALVGGDDGVERSRPSDEAKLPYRDVAAAPGLWWRCALAGLVLAAGLGARAGWNPALPMLVYLVPVGIALAVVDWRTRYLPTWLIAPSYGVVVALALLGVALGRHPHHLLGALTGWLLEGGTFFAVWWLTRGAMAYGDVRLAGLLGIALGYLGLPFVVLGLLCASLVQAGVSGLTVSLRVFHRRHVPFGPALLAGAWLAVVFTDQIAGGLGWLVTHLASLA